MFFILYFVHSYIVSPINKIYIITVLNLQCLGWEGETGFIPCNTITANIRPWLCLLDYPWREEQGVVIVSHVTCFCVFHTFAFLSLITSQGKLSFLALERNNFLQFYFRLGQGLGAWHLYSMTTNLEEASLANLQPDSLTKQVHRNWHCLTVSWPCYILNSYLQERKDSAREGEMAVDPMVE